MIIIKKKQGNQINKKINKLTKDELPSPSPPFPSPSSSPLLPSSPFAQTEDREKTIQTHREAD